MYYIYIDFNSHVYSIPKKAPQVGFLKLDIIRESGNRQNLIH